MCLNVTPFNNADNFFPQYDVIFHYQKSIGIRNCIMELCLSCSVSTIFLYNLQKIKVEQNITLLEYIPILLQWWKLNFISNIYYLKKFYICYSFRMNYFFIVQFSCSSIIKIFINDLSCSFFVLQTFKRIYIPSIFHLIVVRFKDNQNHYLSFFTTYPLDSY